MLKTLNFDHPYWSFSKLKNNIIILTYLYNSTQLHPCFTQIKVKLYSDRTLYLQPDGMVVVSGSGGIFVCVAGQVFVLATLKDAIGENVKSLHNISPIQ